MTWRGSVDGFDELTVCVRSTRALGSVALAVLVGFGGVSAAFAEEARGGLEAPGLQQSDLVQGVADAPPTTTFLSGAVYLLCAGTSCICAVLLLRGYAKNAVRLLFWSGLCFVGLALDNAMLYVDLVVVPDVNIAIWRRVPALLALTLLIYGLVWDSK